jgi:hypothetical protein
MPIVAAAVLPEAAARSNIATMAVSKLSPTGRRK